jgi:hypothetical protein
MIDADTLASGVESQLPRHIKLVFDQFSRTHTHEIRLRGRKTTFARIRKYGLGGKITADPWAFSTNVLHKANLPSELVNPDLENAVAYILALAQLYAGRSTARNPEEGEEEEEPFDRDDLEQGYVIADGRSGYDVSRRRTYLDTFDDYDDAVIFVAQDMERERYYPDVFYVNDHGNVDLLSLKPTIKRGRVVKVESSTVRSWG